MTISSNFDETVPNRRRRREGEGGRGGGVEEEGGLKGGGEVIREVGGFEPLLHDETPEAPLPTKQEVPN